MADCESASWIPDFTGATPEDGRSSDQLSVLDYLDHVRYTCAGKFVSQRRKVKAHSLTRRITARIITTHSFLLA